MASPGGLCRLASGRSAIPRPMARDRCAKLKRSVQATFTGCRLVGPLSRGSSPCGPHKRRSHPIGWLLSCGVPTGIRTPVTTVKGRRSTSLIQCVADYVCPKCDSPSTRVRIGVRAICVCAGSAKRTVSSPGFGDSRAVLCTSVNFPDSRSRTRVLGKTASKEVPDKATR